MKSALAGLLAALLASTALAQTPPPPGKPPSDNLAVVPIPPEAQAEEANLIRGKIERAGFTDVIGLSRDAWGVWRGRARRGDQVVDILVDKGGRIKTGAP